jgi:hypothetical protein
MSLKMASARNLHSRCRLVKSATESRKHGAKSNCCKRLRMRRRSGEQTHRASGGPELQAPPVITRGHGDAFNSRSLQWSKLDWPLNRHFNRPGRARDELAPAGAVAGDLRMTARL